MKPGRYLPHLLALLVTGTAGAYVPGEGAATRSGAAVAPGDSPDTGDYEGMLAELDGQERKLQQEIRDTEAELEIVRRRMIARGRAYYRLVRAGLLPVGGGFDALVDHATRVERLRAALQRDVAADVKARERGRQAAKELRRIRAERAPLAVQRQAMARAKSALHEAEERRAAFERAFGSSQPPPDHVAIYGASSDSAGGGSSRPFAQSHGQLSFPLAGRAEVLTPQGMPEPGGLTLRSAHDSVVRSVAAGRVVFAGPYAAYGNTVVIDHGEHYFSLYASLQRIDVTVGQALPDLGPVGRVSRQGQQPPQLYFELRHRERVLKARSWLGI